MMQVNTGFLKFIICFIDKCENVIYKRLGMFLYYGRLFIKPNTMPVNV